MKKLLTLLVLTFVIGFGSFNPVKASHFAGADLTYLCLGGNTYRVTLSFYRDCSGIPVQSAYTIHFVCSSNAAFNFNTSISQIAGTGVEITPGCSAQPTSCTSGSNSQYGIREYVYQGTVTLPPCNSWHMSFSGSARNPITTLSGSGSWYMPATLNNLQAPCNSSPTFSNKPIAVVCNNQSFCFNHGAVDPDGDSLSYSFYAPMVSATSSVTYNFPYTYTNFLASATPITLDPVTGDICFTPTQIQSTVTGIKVQEWRKINGVPTVVGEVYRDIQMKVTQCNNTIPIISGMDTTLSGIYNPNDTTFYIEKCLSTDPITFSINGFDADTFNPGVIGNPEVFHINWNNGIPGATFTPHYNGTDSAYATFSWMPTAADVGTTPRCFTATIHDEACPYYGSQTFSYCIVVRGMLVDIGSDTLLCSGETALIKADADTTTVNYIWRLDGNSMGIPLSQDSVIINSNTLGVGSHVLSIETNDGTTTMVCPGVDAINVNVVYQPNINGTLKDSAFCGNGAVTYDAGQGTMYTWVNLITGLPVGASQTYTTSSNGIYSVQVDGGQNTRCVDTDTFQVVQIDPITLGPDTCLWLSDAPYVQDAGIISPDNVYEWNTGDDTRTINISTSGTYSITIHHPTISPTVGCSDSRVVNVIDKDNFILSVPYMASEDSPMPGEDWTTGDQTVCTYQRVRMKGPQPPNGHSYSYDWKKDGVQCSITDFYFFKEENVGTYEMSLNVGGCEDVIHIKAENCDVEVPNIITPNGDGSNDNFKIVIKGTTKGFYESFPNSSLIIYNRWGKKVYESNNYQNDWDGESLSDGVYFWTLQLADGKETEMTGTITIMRK